MSKSKKSNSTVLLAFGTFLLLMVVAPLWFNSIRKELPYKALADHLEQKGSVEKILVADGYNVSASVTENIVTLKANREKEVPFPSGMYLCQNREVFTFRRWGDIVEWKHLNDCSPLNPSKSREVQAMDLSDEVISRLGTDTLHNFVRQLNKIYGLTTEAPEYVPGG